MHGFNIGFCVWAFLWQPTIASTTLTLVSKRKSFIIYLCKAMERVRKAVLLMIRLPLAHCTIIQSN